MGILEILLRNLAAPARTLSPLALPPAPNTYRGALTHDASRCTACGTCAFVCAPKAITFEEHADQSVSWKFFIGQCSFCGLCAQNCPTAAIGNAGQIPATALTVNGGGLRLESRIERVACTRCGAPHVPLPADAYAKLLAGNLSGVSESERGYCPECRRRVSGERLREAFRGPAPAARPADRELP